LTDELERRNETVSRSLPQMDDHRTVRLQPEFDRHLFGNVVVKLHRADARRSFKAPNGVPADTGRLRLRLVQSRRAAFQSRRAAFQSRRAASRRMLSPVRLSRCSV